jgi:uncharacterized protein
MSITLCLLFFTIALLYSSAGFGGGSSYLALLALWHIEPHVMKPIGLLCNIVVVTGGVYHFYKQGHLPMKKALPISLISIPLAFIGSLIPLKEQTFFLLLGCALVAAALLMGYRMFLEKAYVPKEGGKKEIYKYGIIGGLIGLLSGMTSIGGGIYLSPVLRLGRYDTPKNIAGICSFFILVNSISGLLGQTKAIMQLDWHFVAPLMLSVIIGGQIGARLSAAVLKQRVVEIATAVLILYAGVYMLVK